MLTAHEEGDFSSSGLLARLLLRDDRIASCLETRVNALLGCKEEIEGAQIDDDTEEEEIRDAAREWWPKRVTESARRALESDAKMHAVAFGEVIYERTSKVWTPVDLRPWDVGAFRWDNERDCYLVQTRDRVEKEVRHGDGRWVVYEPYGKRGWHNGLICSLADKWLMRQWTWRDWARFTEKLGQGVFAAKVPGGASDTAKSNFLAQVARIGTNAAIALPQGETPGSSFDLSLLSTNGTGFQNFETFTAALNVSIAVRILGQNLTTEAQGGSYAAANVQDRVRGDLLNFDAEVESTTLHTGILQPWTVANYGDAALAPWSYRATEPAEDQKAAADTRKVMIDTIVAAAGLSNRIDVDHELEEIGFVLLDESKVKDEPLPAPPPAPAADPSLSLNSVRLASASSPSAPFIAGQKWLDGLVKEAVVMAQPSTDKIVASVIKASKQATSYDDLRQRLIILAAEAPDAESEGLVEKAILLALGQGTYSASLEIDASS